MGFGRSCLYHQDYPKGKIFENEEEYFAALRSGAVDAPWEIDNPEYVPPALKGLNETEGEPEMKPWQKAQAARKAKLEEKKRQQTPKPKSASGGK